MAEERLFTVAGGTATPVDRTTLTEAGLRERDHLQEWVIAHPEILGDDIKVITFEFDRWITGCGTTTSERLDVLALDRTGNLVLAELKRDRAPDSVMVQALNYAAMVSRFSVDLLAEAYAAHKSDGRTSDECLDELREWAPTLSDETLAPPTIVLVAEDFGPVLTNTAMFLIEQGLDLRLVRVQLYRLGDALVLSVSQVLPVPDAEEFMVRPRSGAQTQRAARAAATRRASIPERLVAAQALEEGQELRIVVPAGVAQDREAIAAWLDGDPERPVARWRHDSREPVEWAVDGKAWNLTTLIRHIIRAATGSDPTTPAWGPNWYEVVGDGRLLREIAEDLPEAEMRGFDWSSLHALLAAVPRGRWTTYGDLAQVVGTGAQALGQHIASCADCPNAHRVLGRDGRPRANFRWSDSSDPRTQQEALEGEGLRFENGSSPADARLDPRALVAARDASASF